MPRKEIVPVKNVLLKQHVISNVKNILISYNQYSKYPHHIITKGLEHQEHVTIEQLNHSTIGYRRTMSITYIMEICQKCNTASVCNSGLCLNCRTLWIKVYPSFWKRSVWNKLFIIILIVNVLMWSWIITTHWKGV